MFGSRRARWNQITDGDITIARLHCGCVQFYIGHDVEVNLPVLCAGPDNDHPTGHGETAIQRVIRTAVVRVTETVAATGP